MMGLLLNEKRSSYGHYLSNTLIQVCSSESYRIFSHTPGDRVCGKTIGLVFCVCLCMSVCLKAAPCRGPSREYGEDDQYGAENFHRISRSLSGTVVSERDEAPVSSHSFVSRIRVSIQSTVFLLLGKNTLYVKGQGKLKAVIWGKAMCTQQK